MTEAPRRFPRRVYEQGSDPDTRFSLANERTYLAWTRSAMALVAGSVAVHTPYLTLNPIIRLGLSLWLLALAALCICQAYARWRRVETALRTGTEMPGFGGALILGAGLLVLVLAVIAGSTAEFFQQT